MLKLTATPESRQDVKELAAFFDSLRSPTPGMQKGVGDVVRSLFERRFDNEGGPGGHWVGLARMTQLDREEQGYNPLHPILQRTGEYKFSFTDLGRSDNIENLITRQDGWTLELGSSDWRVNELEGGRSDMAARPVTLFDDSEEEDIGDVLDRLFQQAADDMGVVRGT